MTKPIMKTEDYVAFYSELSAMMFTKHIQDVYIDDPYETQKNGDITIKSKYEDIWLEIVDDVCETIDKFIIKE
jgi:hypothetical protein